MTATRMTRQRAALLDALRDGGFRSAQGWHERLRADGSTVGLATVYRGLQALSESGEVDTVVTDSGETLYRHCGPGEDEHGHHHHLRCRECGRAVDIDVPGFETIVAELASHHGYRDISHTIELSGVCPECAAAARD
ncbi:Fur family transcriptional regulator [Demequina pelophila]|uniref:Fur family transcriptional regulator n=1 Tax=Demequina pelophila TaxID=1638984 RepID=UPI000AAFCDC2|nr:Fur family transcriptional regulator [Demequina pelophila]